MKTNLLMQECRGRSGEEAYEVLLSRVHFLYLHCDPGRGIANEGATLGSRCLDEINQFAF